MIFFSKRMKLAELYKKWIKENMVLDCPFSVICFLSIHGLINEEKALNFIQSNERK